MKCDNCEIKEATNKCANCKILRYCSKECQIEDWDKQHKDGCSFIQELVENGPDFFRIGIDTNDPDSKKRGREEKDKEKDEPEEKRNRGDDDLRNYDLLIDFLDKTNLLNQYFAENKTTLLHEAARENRADITKQLLDKGVDLNIRNDNGYTPLNIAVIHDAVDVFDLLVKKGAEFDTRVNIRGYPVVQAIENESLNIIKYILDNRDELNITLKDIDKITRKIAEENKFDLYKLVMENQLKNIEQKNLISPLYQFAINNNLIAVKYIIEEQKLIKAEDINNIYLVKRLASQEDLYDVLDYLLQVFDLDINKRPNIDENPRFDDSGKDFSALMETIRWSNARAMKLLLEKGAKTNLLYSTVYPKNEEIHGRTQTALYWAIYYGNLEIIKLLVKADAELFVEGSDKKDKFYIGLLVDSSNMENSQVLVKYLIETFGWDPTSLDGQGMTLMDGIIRNLISRRDITHLVKTGLYFIEIAPLVTNLWLESLKLRSQEISIEYKDFHNEIRLHILIYMKNLSNVDTITFRNTPILSTVCIIGDLDIVKVLVEKKRMGLNVKDRFGYTPLHNAVDYGHLDIVKYLLENGADVNAKDKNGRAPLYYAFTGEKLEILKYILKKFPRPYFGWDTFEAISNYRIKDDILELIKSGYLFYGSKSAISKFRLSSLVNRLQEWVDDAERILYNARILKEKFPRGVLQTVVLPRFTPGLNEWEVQQISNLAYENPPFTTEYKGDLVAKLLEFNSELYPDIVKNIPKQLLKQRRKDKIQARKEEKKRQRNLKKKNKK